MFGDQFQKNDKEIAGLQFEDGLTKKVYWKVMPFLEDLRVHYKDGQADQLVNLTNSGVEIHDFGQCSVWRTTPRSLYLGQKLDKTLTVLWSVVKQVKAVAGSRID